MVKIRLMRVGKRKQPSFRVVVADARSPRDGRIIEAIGHYQPRQDPSVVEIDNERALYWLRNGAQPSSSVQQLLRISGAWSEFSGEAPVAAPAAPSPRKRATAAASVTQAEDTGEASTEAPTESDAAAEDDSAAMAAETTEEEPGS